MLKYFGLAVFASTCFIAGFFSGEWTAYDGYALRDMLTYHNKSYEKVVETQLAMKDVDAYVLLSLAGKGPDALEELRQVKEDRVVEIVSAFRRDLEDERYEMLEPVLRTYLSLVEGALAEHAHNNGLNSTAQSGTN